MINSWSVAINENLMNSIVYLDLSKAFDLINHTILLTKLKTYKCSLKCLNVFESLLTNIIQCTTFQGKESDKLPVSTGVPQGSVLGPLFYILFINDLPMSLNNCEIQMYANDSTVTATGKTTEETNEKLNCDLDHVRQWCTNNHMLANPKKTKTMLITSRQKRQILKKYEKFLKFSWVEYSLAFVLMRTSHGRTILRILLLRYIRN